MKNSARFGWRWYNNQLELLGFVHIDGQFYFNKICSVGLGINYLCSIEIQPDHYCFSVGWKKVIFPRDNRIRTDKIKYYLYPYFGGDETAPHDIFIKLEEIS